MKAMLGPSSTKFDDWDETGRRRRPAGIVTIRTATVMNNVTALSLNQEPLVVERFKEGI